MVVRIKTGKRIQGALTYNEQKVKQGKAELILASRFGGELHRMGFSQKLERFQMLIRRNQYVKRNTLHLSINFSPNDRVDKAKMQLIAADYMKRIGFGDQPYLVYYHSDTAHPHIHIVTTNIKVNARPINMHKLAVLKSEPARKAMEVEFDLIPAESVRREVMPALRPVNLVGILSGKAEEKRQISNVVKNICASYQFRDLEEFNAILAFFNVVADPGKEGSRQRQFKGLVYAAIDQDGERIGTGIKASSLDTKPTLAMLQYKFDLGQRLREGRLANTRKKLEKILSLSNPKVLAILTSPDSNAKIELLPQRDEKGTLTGFQILDHQQKILTSSQELELSEENIAKMVRSGQALQHQTVSEVEAVNLATGFAGSGAVTGLIKGLLISQGSEGGGGGDIKKRKKKKKPK